MRNILVILAMFVCTSICLGDTGQTITISGDIGERPAEWKKKLEQLEVKWKEEQERRVKEWRLEAALKKEQYRQQEWKLSREVREEHQQQQQEEQLLEAECEKWLNDPDGMPDGWKRAEREKEVMESHMLQAEEQLNLEVKLKKKLHEKVLYMLSSEEQQQELDELEQLSQMELEQAHRNKLKCQEKSYLHGSYSTLDAQQKLKLDELEKEQRQDREVKMAASKERRKLKEQELKQYAKNWEKYLEQEHGLNREEKENAKKQELAKRKQELEHEQERERAELGERQLLKYQKDNDEWEEKKNEYMKQLLRWLKRCREKLQDMERTKERLAEWDAAREALLAAELAAELEKLERDAERELEREKLKLDREELWYPDIAGNGDPNQNSENYGKVSVDGWHNPNDNRLVINTRAKVGNAYGAYMNAAGVRTGDYKFRSMTNNEIISNDVNFNGCNIAGAWADDDIADLMNVSMNVSSNRVIITRGRKIDNVYGGRTKNGIVSSNTVTIGGVKDVTIGGSVHGGYAYSGTVSSNTVTITTGTTVSLCVYGGCVINGNAVDNRVTLISGTVRQIIYGGYVHTKGNAMDNTVTITGERVGRNVYGGYIVKNGTATGNKVNLTGVTVEESVFGARIGTGLASSNTVTIINGETVQNVYGVYIHQNGTATLNTVNLTSVTATKDVYGAWIGTGLASSNTVTIINGETVQNVYGGYIVKDGTATGNTVTISGGKVKGNVFGGYVGGNGQATHNTINITAAELSSKQSFPEFSTESILCGGICADATTNDAFTGNTLNIETKGVVVKGISNFEKYNFNLKDIKPGETVLTATGGGCSWNTREHNYTSDCAVDLSKSSISSLRTQGVLNKKDRFTLIKSPHGFEGKAETKQCEFENEELLIKYCWDIKIADNKQELVAILADKKIRDEGFARSLSEGYGAGIVCVNNGMDCIFSKIEETEEQSSKDQSPKSLLGEGANLGAKLQRKGEIGVFGGLTASKSKYDIDKGSHIDMTGMSMMGGVGKVVEVREKELTVGVFAEYGTGNSDIQKLSFSGLSPCENKNEGKSSYTGGGLLGRYNIYENEFSGTKLYGEAILRAGQVENKFDSKKMKDSKGKEYKYKYADAMYGGCAVGGGYKHKVSENIDLDWSLRYMFGRQREKDVKREDADGNRMKFKNVTSNRIRIGVRGKYVELEKIKPYAGIGCEYELDGKVKGAIENGADMIDMPVSDFGGVTGIGELGVSGKVWKFGVDISGQGYLGVRKGFGGMLKLKYAFGKDAHGSKASSKASSKAPGSKSSGSKASTKP